MKKVLTVGVFDLFHLGHLRLFQRAKSLGDYLVVAVQEGDFILKFKPETQILYSTEERIEIIQSLRVVDKVVTYTAIDESIPNIDFDVFAIGEDQNHVGFQHAVEWCRTHGKEVVRLPRTPGICSSQLKKMK